MIPTEVRIISHACGIFRNAWRIILHQVEFLWNRVGILRNLVGIFPTAGRILPTVGVLVQAVRQGLLVGHCSPLNSHQ